MLNKIQVYCTVFVVMLLISSCGQSTPRQEQVTTNEEEVITQGIDFFDYLIGAEKIEKLIELVEAENLSSTTEASLVAKLNNALDKSDILREKLDDNPDACNSRRGRISCASASRSIRNNLEQFIDQVEHLSTETTTRRGKVVPAVISEENAALLMAIAQACIDGIPIIISPDTASVEENQTGAIDVESLDNHDSEGAGLAYSLTGAIDDGLFSIDPNGGVVTFDAAPDFETPGDAGADNVYDIQVTVTDTDGLTDVQDIAVTVTDVNEPINIPDNDPTGVSDSKIVTDSGNVGVLKVKLDITHSYVGDLIITLEHVASGITVTLIERPGLPSVNSDWGCAGNDINNVISDSATLFANTDCAGSFLGFVGNAYLADTNYQPLGSLSDFNGLALNSEWKITVSDNFGDDTGILNSWSLIFE